MFSARLVYFCYFVVNPRFPNEARRLNKRMDKMRRLTRYSTSTYPTRLPRGAYLSHRTSRRSKNKTPSGEYILFLLFFLWQLAPPAAASLTEVGFFLCQVSSPSFFFRTRRVDQEEGGFFFNHSLPHSKAISRCKASGIRHLSCFSRKHSYVMVCMFPPPLPWP